MARMIGPSTLEGEALFNWYRRSPADVEAEREATRQAQYDAFVKSIGGASDAQDGATSEADDSGNDAGAVTSGDGDASLVKARYFRPAGPIVIAPSVMEPPSGPQVGPSVDSRGGPAEGAARSGFFGTHGYSPALGGYFTDLPPPLNTVSPNANSHWWELGDGSLAQSDEVERIYAEQQRRLKGQEDAEPALRVRSVNNLKDGQIPRADQVAKGERELDPTCAPNGAWERDPNFNSYSDRTKRYETQITRAPGLDYVVRNPGQPPVKFDGCAVWDPRHPLPEAKGPGYASLLHKAIEWSFYRNMRDKALSQAKRQAEAARDQRVEWHIAEPGAFQFFQNATESEQPPIVPQVTPARW